MARVAAIGCAFPEHYYSQAEFLDELARVWGGREAVTRVELLTKRAGVEGRHFGLRLEQYADLHHFEDSNDAYLRLSAELGERAVASALTRAGLTPAHVDQIISVSVTGIATPSLDAVLANRLRFRSDVKRVPIFGLGCVAGAAGLARAHDYLRGFPDQVVVLLAVELCTLTFQRGDRSVSNLIATALFADGAAAVVLVGDRVAARGPRLVASRSVLYPETQHVMGWRVTQTGLNVVLSADVPALVKDNLRRDVESFLADQGLSLAQIGCYVVHPGGPKVLRVIEEELELVEGALAVSWQNLRRLGNLSSASVLVNLRDTLDQRAVEQGCYGLLLAMGPGFCLELVLLQW